MPPRMHLPKTPTPKVTAPTADDHEGPSTRRTSRRTAHPLSARESSKPTTKGPSQETPVAVHNAPSSEAPAGGSRVPTRRTPKQPLPPLTAVPFAQPSTAASAPLIDSESSDSTFNKPEESASHDFDLNSLLSEHSGYDHLAAPIQEPSSTPAAAEFSNADWDVETEPAHSEELSAHQLPTGNERTTETPALLTSDSSDSTFSALAESGSHSSDFKSLTSENPTESSGTPEPNLAPASPALPSSSSGTNVDIAAVAREIEAETPNVTPEEEGPKIRADSPRVARDIPESSRAITTTRRRTKRKAHQERDMGTTADKTRTARGEYLLMNPLSEGSSGSAFNAPSTPRSSDTSYADSAAEGGQEEYPNFVVAVIPDLMSRMQQFTEPDLRGRAINRQGKDYKSG